MGLVVCKFVGVGANVRVGVAVSLLVNESFGVGVGLVVRTNVGVGFRVTVACFSSAFLLEEFLLLAEEEREDFRLLLRLESVGKCVGVPSVGHCVGL